MGSLLTKVAKGIAFGDVSNVSVRNILTEVSKRLYGKFTEQEMYDTLEYFDWKCPYTGKDLRNAIDNNLGGYVTDHIYPQNKEFCGLNVKGNLVIVDKEANAKKGSKSIKEFMLDRSNDAILGTSMSERQDRLKKIEEFQKCCGYDPDAIRNALAPLLSARYDKVRNEQEQSINDAIKAIGLPEIAPRVCASTQSVKPIHKKRNIPELIFNPTDEEIFKQELLKNKNAKFVLTYDSGAVKTSLWKVKQFDIDSNLRANIQSRPFWRNKNKEGLVKVEVFIE